MKRPNFNTIETGSEFNQWYWRKDELIEIFKAVGLPCGGTKSELRDRIIFALDNNGKLKPTKKKLHPKSDFNWARAQLFPETIITDSVSFGLNFRNFMKSHIGTKFSCHSDFMHWVKSNPGKTLQDAIVKWKQMELRKDKPDFRRDIPKHNMLNQYLRDFLDGNVDKSFRDALHYWEIKKRMPMENGFVKYAASDLKLGAKD